jgi:hypothetical protein
MDGSKAVHTDGSPMRMYHTTRNDFHSFQSGRTTKNSGTFGDWETQRHAIFVTPHHEASQAYGKLGDKFESGANVMPLHISVKNPLDLRDGAHRTFELGDKFKEHGINPNWLAHFSWGHFDDEDGKNFVEAAKKMGHDAVIFHDEHPDHHTSFETWAVSSIHTRSSLSTTGVHITRIPRIFQRAHP